MLWSKRSMSSKIDLMVTSMLRCSKGTTVKSLRGTGCTGQVFGFWTISALWLFCQNLSPIWRNYSCLCILFIKTRFSEWNDLFTFNQQHLPRPQVPECFTKTCHETSVWSAWRCTRAPPDPTSTTSCSLSAATSSTTSIRSLIKDIRKNCQLSTFRLPIFFQCYEPGYAATPESSESWSRSDPQHLGAGCPAPTHRTQTQT